MPIAPMARANPLILSTAALFLVFALSLLVDVYTRGANQLSAFEWLRWHPAQSAGLGASHQTGTEFLLGVGKADITGPVVEINLMGYANTSQVGSGLRQRLYSRAFIIGERDPKSAEHRFIYVVLDTQSGDTAIRDGILRGLRGLGPAYALYQQSNLAVTGTHSHSGPGAWLNYLLPQITSKGFSKESYNAIVDGALLSITRAHESLTPGTIAVGKTRIEDANINRSLFAYLANPEAERGKYADSVDKDLTLLSFTRSSDGKAIGVLTWFAVHGTSMLGNNTLITGDNKGVAAYLLEKSMGPGFVAGFSQANVGDASPNVMGAYCEDGSNELCRLEDSTCGGRSEPCHGRGPFFGLDDEGTRSCFEIGRRQFVGARNLLDSMTAGFEGTPVTNNVVRSAHRFVSLDGYEFKLPNGSIATTCSAALGYGFAAGTSDGPGQFDFKQNSSGNPNASPVWAVVRDFLHKPSEDQRRCQYPKPILLDVGETTRPYAWAPNVVDIQLLRVGQLIIIVSPGEATTMAGRRWRAAIKHAAASEFIFQQNSAKDISLLQPIVLLGGPANSYTHYITTEEEYGAQRYEGASTLYGPHTLDAYINLTLSTLPYVSEAASGGSLPGPEPPVNTNNSLSFITGVVVDRAGLKHSFGDVVQDVRENYAPGQVAEATFIGANPRNNGRLEGTYASVERLLTGAGHDILKPRAGIWEPFRTDEDWELVFRWRRTSTILGTSEVTVQWEIPPDIEFRGRYRLRYFGDAKSLGGTITAFEGMSGEFQVG